MSYKDVFLTIKADYRRYSTKGWNLFEIIKLMRIDRGFVYLVWVRLSSVNGCLWFVSRLIHHRLSTKYRINIQTHTQIAGGLYLPNCWNIVIHPNCIIGRNVTIHEYVNIGANNGESAIIGNDSIINSRVCIVGAIKIGSGSEVLAGSVVTRDVEPYTLVAGSPAFKIGVKEV